jgi:hypothetical protein
MLSSGRNTKGSMRQKSPVGAESGWKPPILLWPCGGGRCGPQRNALDTVDTWPREEIRSARELVEMKPAKKSDCVQMKDGIQARLRAEWQGLTERKSVRRSANTSQPPTARSPTGGEESRRQNRSRGAPNLRHAVGRGSTVVQHRYRWQGRHARSPWRTRDQLESSPGDPSGKKGQWDGRLGRLPECLVRRVVRRWHDRCACLWCAWSHYWGCKGSQYPRIHAGVSPGANWRLNRVFSARG